MLSPMDGHDSDSATDTRVSSGFAVVMAESPSEAAQEEAKVIPGIFRFRYEHQQAWIDRSRVIEEWYQLCSSN